MKLGLMIGMGFIIWSKYDHMMIWKGWWVSLVGFYNPCVWCVVLISFDDGYGLGSNGDDDDGKGWRCWWWCYC